MPNIFGFVPVSIRPIILGMEEEEIKPETPSRQKKKENATEMKDEKEFILLEDNPIEN